eukprot:CAMPEP_0183713286 /NCGR_PEP_ID=MMETSP0737-20130205/8167_1 /TAXON_ID=385413 /ORGANISM="Thalassiosira miniscula, Strain CCMP1093" /LENGTH=819 /DNA_ID=CAMNT_0025942047 /DNA_START=243 /DNA_END=2702 /DNA_ORIENTATION=-
MSKAFEKAMGRYLRKQPSSLRGLESLFVNEYEETPSRDVTDENGLGVYDAQYEGEGAWKNGPQDNDPEPIAIGLGPPSPSKLQQDSDSASWDTRATILLVECIVVTIIFGTILICCVRKHRRRAIQQRLVSVQALQEWATIRIGSGPGGASPAVVEELVAAAAASSGGRDGRMRMDSGIGGMSVGSRGGSRIRVDSGIGGMSVGSSRGGRRRGDSGIAGMSLDGSRNSGIVAMSISGRRDGRARIDSGITGMSLDGSRNGGIPSLTIAGPRDGRARMDSGITGMSLDEPRHGRARIDSGISGMASARQDDTPLDVVAEAGNTETGTSRNRSPISRILAIPRAIGNVLIWPLRMIEAGVNDWAMENYDEVFLRQFMENLEAEREAARENPEERETRLKEAFVKECMVWELDDEDFIPPSELYTTLSDVGGKVKDDPVKVVIENIDDEDYALYGLGELNEEDEQDIEEGNRKIEHATVTEDVKAENEEVAINGSETVSEGIAREGKQEVVKNEVEEAPKEASDAAEEEDEQQDCVTIANDCRDETSVDIENPPEDSHQIVENSKMASAEEPNVLNNNATTIEQPGLPMIVEDDTSPLFMDDSSSEGNRPRFNSAPTLSAAAMYDNTLDSDSTPEFLYLNSSGHRRRRANTGSSTGTTSSTNPPAMATADSMDSFASVSASSSSQSSHKIPNQCAICLCDYEKGDIVVTSCNSECPHAFHQRCIVEWLVKMQEGTPCPCCRRQFVNLDEHIPRSISSGTVSTNNNNTNNNANNNNTINESTNNTAQDPEEAERLRQERRRQHIELGIRRGGRAFNTSVISMR